MASTARKLCKAARRAGHNIGREKVARHMRTAGARRGSCRKLVRPGRSMAGWWAVGVRIGCGTRVVAMIGRQGDEERGALANFGRDLNLAAVLFHDCLGYG